MSTKEIKAVIFDLDGVIVSTDDCHYRGWKKITLVTPIDKKENIKFYTEKCGFDIVSIEMDGNVKVARFVLEK